MPHTLHTRLIDTTVLLFEEVPASHARREEELAAAGDGAHEGGGVMSMHDPGILDKEEEIPPASLYTFRGFYVPERMMPGIRRYIDHGNKPGNFLSAVIQNNLHDALSFADYENLKNLPAFMGISTTKLRRGAGGHERTWQHG